MIEPEVFSEAILWIGGSAALALVFFVVGSMVWEIIAYMKEVEEHESEE
jgi:hypothetical protein